nr:MAG TPA: hypothetical protein [Caudoviricetes sp.]
MLSGDFAWLGAVKSPQGNPPSTAWGVFILRAPIFGGSFCSPKL